MYARMGSKPLSRGWLTVLRSHISAWLSSPAEQMWQLECGAQARLLTLAWCLCSSATGSVGKRMSSTITCSRAAPRQPPRRASKRRSAAEHAAPLGRLAGGGRTLVESIISVAM